MTKNKCIDCLNCVHPLVKNKDKIEEYTLYYECDYEFFTKTHKDKVVTFISVLFDCDKWEKRIE